MKRKLEFTTSAEVKVVNSDILSNEDELEFLEMRTAVLKFDFSKVSKLARVTDDSLINEFRRFLVLKAIKTGNTFILLSIIYVYIVSNYSNRYPRENFIPIASLG